MATKTTIEVPVEEQTIQNEIASLVIRGEAKQHCKIKVSAQDGEFKVEVENI